MSGDTSVTHFEDLIKSDLFTFRVGLEKTTFVVHSQAIAGTSDPFKALVNGSLAEATERSAVIEDIRADDFVRFVEYAYRRDYTIPSWTPDDALAQSEHGAAQLSTSPAETTFSPKTVLIEEDIVAFSDSWDRGGTLSGKKKKMKPSDEWARLRAEFRGLNYTAEGLPSVELSKHSTPYRNDQPDQDFTNILLAHARMYTIADTYLVLPLKTLALHKLHRTLCEFTLFDRRVKDITELCRYAYQNGHDRAKNGALDRLRELVVVYMAIEVSTFSSHKLFLKLIEEGGEFVSDFWVKAARNML